MLHLTEDVPKVSTRSVNPYARESSPKKLQQDRNIDGLSKTTSPNVSMIVYPKSGPYLKLDFLPDANTSKEHKMNKEMQNFLIFFEVPH